MHCRSLQNNNIDNFMAVFSKLEALYEPLATPNKTHTGLQLSLLLCFAGTWATTT
jgi:hypothetical protein